jgi:class 3 adenylate cyclase/predicted ATPase
MNKLRQWCESIGMGKYAEVLVENEVDLDVLPELTNEDLKELDIPLGARKKLLKAIEHLHPGEQTAGGAVAFADAEDSAPLITKEAERRQVTVMFCDLVGSTALSVQLDPEEMRRIIQTYRDCCVNVIERFGGQVARLIGDGILAFFGYPRAHENDAERAVLSALDLIEAVGQLETPRGITLQVRIGIATGPVVVGDLISSGALFGDDVIGETPNLAARLQGMAQPNALIIAGNTKRLLGGLFDYADLGEHELKGFPQPVPVWQVTGKRSIASRFEAVHTLDGLTPMVGREEEVELLERRWQSAESGEGQVVMLSGEAGIGKSRITQHLRDSLQNRPHTHLLYYCSPYYQSSALFPVINQIERAARFSRDDSTAEKLDKLEALLRQSTSDHLDETVPLFAALLSIPTGQRYPPLEMTPQRQKEKTLESLLELLACLARENPVLVVFEDLHWVDPTTLELIDRFVEQIRTLPVLLILTFRPDFTPPSWVDYPYVSLHTLNRLNETKTAEITAELTGGKALPPQVLEQITLRTDGVPLFVEELTKTVLEAGFLKEEDDRYTLDGPLPSFAIPSTLQDSLMARLDRLEAAKEIVQIGAVIGRYFSYELVAELSPLKDQILQNALQRLTETRLISGRGMPPHVTYAFKHALVRDAAYLSLLRSKQQVLHARIAKVLEERFPEQVETEPELVAYHYSEAGLGEQAIDYWYKAGQRAVDRSANTEALVHLGRGLEQLAQLPADIRRDRLELRLQTARAAALQATRGFSAAETGDAYRRARELCGQLSDAPEIFPVLHGSYLFHVLRGEIDLAYQVSTECLQLAQHQNDPIALLFGHRTVGASLLHLGQFDAARNHLSKMLMLAESHQQTQLSSSIYGLYPKTAATTFLGLVLFALGYPEQAAKAAADALANAEEVGHLQNLGFALYWANMTGIQRCEMEAVRTRAQRLLTLSQEHELPHWAAFALFQYGLAVAMLDDSSGGIAGMNQALHDHRALGSELYLPSMLTALAGCLIRAGQLEQAMAKLVEAMTIAEKNRETWYLAEIHRVKGDLLAQQGESAAAESCFHKALEIARYQNARSWELRAATGLARLWYRQGKHGEAGDLLEPVYHWFSEGLDTADLVAARRLLEALSCNDGP